MAEAGSAAAVVTSEDLSLLDALDIEGGEEEAGGKGEEEAGGKGEEETKGAGEEETKGAGEEEENTKWFEETITDESLRKFAGEFETQDALMEAMSGLQKALGMESVKDWRKGIEDEKLQEHASRFTSPADVVKHHLELRQKLSSALIPPGKGASKEDKEVFASRLSKMLGVPEKPEDYEFPALEKGVELTDDEKQSRTEWAGFFHQIHLPKPMASAILSQIAKKSVEDKEAVKVADDRFAEKSTAQLEAEWGEDYDVNRTSSVRAARELFGDEFDSVMQAEMSNGRLLMDSTFMLRGLARIGREMDAGSMDVMTDSEKETIDDQVLDVRQRAADAKDEGNTRLANKLFKEEQELLSKVVGKKPIVGGGRTA